MNIDYFSQLPMPVISQILNLLPEDQLFELHNQLSNKVNRILEGYKRSPSLLPSDLPANLYTRYTFIKKLSLLEKGKAKFGKGDLKECTLDEHLHLVERGFFDTNLFRGKLLRERINRAASATLFFADKYATSTNIDSFASMFMVAKKINLAKQALSELKWIAYYAGIKDILSDQVEELNGLGSKRNCRQEQFFKVSENEKMRFFVCLKSFDEGVIRGYLYLGSLERQLFLHFKSEGKKVIFDSLPEIFRHQASIEKIFTEQSLLLKNEIETSEAFTKL